MSPEIEKLLSIIEMKLGWGESKSWQSRDFENLNQLILDKTEVSLSASTLRRIWGKVEYKHLPSGTTLDTLAKFADYESWRVFVKQHTPVNSPVNTNEEPIVTTAITTTVKSVKEASWRKIVWILFFVIAISFGIFAVKKSKPAIRSGEYNFSSHPVTRKIPNSVVFTYNAAASPTDSVFIQQSWDQRTKTLVDKNLHQYTAVYYEPGFYHAKLFVDTLVVKEHPLLIATDGWLGLIANKMIPVYLDSSDYLFKDSMSLAVTNIQKKNIQMEPTPPFVKYYNLGNFEPVSIRDFSFSADIKNEFKLGAAACQFSSILIFTDDAPIFIPLSVPGCISEINLGNTGEMISGKKNDLSAFGVDFSDWVQVSCKSTADKIQYYVNGKLAYEGAFPEGEMKIIGVAFMFQGTGSVKSINLNSGSKLIFGEFNK